MSGKYLSLFQLTQHGRHGHKYLHTNIHIYMQTSFRFGFYFIKFYFLGLENIFLTKQEMDAQKKKNVQREIEI